MNPPVPSPLERAIVARQAYFEHGLKPDDLIDEAIFRSWTRCTAADRRERDPVEFEPVGRAMLRGLLERSQPLLQAAAGPLDKLARAVSGAGYAVLMTDGAGHALSVGGALDDRAHPMRLAFRQGVDLSEDAIGTSAMSCALSERRAIRVFGPEHFFSATRMFHCAAAPILAPDGSLAGVVDITRDSPRADFGALALVSQCARAIERELFRARPAAHTLKLSWDDSRPEDAQDLLVALGADGEILGMNEQARRFLGERGEGSEHGRGAALHFGDLFEGRFQACMDALRQARGPVPLRLHSGLCLFASAGSPAPPALSTPPARRPAAPRQEALPEFGDAAIPRQLETALRALANRLPVLLLGETGSGKEVAADCLHRRSTRAAGPLVALNCAAIPETLIEGELFGHVEGAYTGARRGGMPGKIELADGGSLFLDEIGDMPLALQARLLRVLETRELSRLGSTASRRVDFQLICATHQDLQQAMREGRFRADLYYRIAGFTVTLPPLRERSGLAALMEALLAEVSAGRRSLAPAALARLLAHPWPGNARELRHALTYAHTVAEPGRPLQPHDFPTLASPPQAAPVAASGLLATLEEEAIQRALKETGGKVAAAARLLGMSRATLYRRLRERR